MDPAIEDVELLRGRGAEPVDHHRHAVTRNGGEIGKDGFGHATGHFVGGRQRLALHPRFAVDAHADLHLALADGEGRFPDARHRTGRKRHAHGAQIGKGALSGCGDLLEAAAGISFRARHLEGEHHPRDAASSRRFRRWGGGDVVAHQHRAHRDVFHPRHLRGQVGMVPQTYVGTDPSQFHDAQWERPYAITAQLSGQLPPPYQGQEIAPMTVFFATVRNRTTDKALEQVEASLTEAEAADLHGYRELPAPPAKLGLYKAGPRDGVWATPPFLHNGSVPNLYEMLVPASERTKKFFLGREFDPVKVGLDTSGKSGTFLFDTSLPGNSNGGHSFENGPLGNEVVGRLLTDEERWALVEYLKSIPEEGGQVTPFGGPSNAVTGNGDFLPQ